MKILCTITTVAGLALATSAYAGHDGSCKHTHGKVSVVTENTITVDDHFYKVGDTTRIKKNGDVAKVKDIKVGDIVCVDTRGKNEMGKEITGVTVLNPADYSTDKERIRETEKVKEVEKEKVRESE